MVPVSSNFVTTDSDQIPHEMYVLGPLLSYEGNWCWGAGFPKGLVHQLLGSFSPSTAQTSNTPKPYFILYV